MPPSGRKGKTRARRAPATERADVRDPSDPDTPDALQTPSRSSRKRARPAESTASVTRNTRRKIKDARTADREDTEGTEAQLSDADLEPALPTEQEIISHLRVAERQVNATEDYANDLLEGQENVPGYGKIAGRDWSFIIRKVEVNIGRPETQEKMTPMTGENGHASTPTAKTIVDIDLGPDRQVSRSHAIITYDPEQRQWFIIVNGRNGLRVDGHLLKRGAKQHLRNGSVVEIANTQMAFITTAADDSDGPVWDASIIKQTQKSSEEDDDGEDYARTTSFHANAHPSSYSQLPPSNGHTAELEGQQQQQQQRSHPHSQRAALQGDPGTPMRSQPTMMQSSPAANYARGVMMESTETIDYSADNAKDLKPPHSYAQLIGMAILSTQDQQMTLNNIYKWIMANYAFYRCNTGGWQNSIRHNLSLNKAFTKIARRTDEPGKGMKWMIEPTEFDTFVQQGMKGCRRPHPIPGTHSTLGSPASPMQSIVMRIGANGVKKDEDMTPPLPPFRQAYATATDAFTPDRGSRRKVNGPTDSKAGLGITGEPTDYEFLPRSTPRNGLTAAANAAGSPPALYVNEEGRVGPLDTPFPLRPSQRLAPPSTLKRPSDFIQFSSPAPFWKMEGLVGSTPFQPYDLSPIKTPFSLKKEDDELKKRVDIKIDVAGEDEDDIEARSKSSPIVTSSSPPRDSSMSLALDASPTISRPATAVAKTLSQMAAMSKDQGGSNIEAQSTRPIKTHTPTPTPTLPQQQPSAPPRNTASVPPVSAAVPHHAYPPAPSHTAPLSYSHGPLNGYADDGEDEGIDLAK